MKNKHGKHAHVRHATGIPYCLTLGPHHMNYEDRHFRSPSERELRSFGAFILSREDCPPPNHTLEHRSLAETPMPSRSEIEDILGAAAIGGLQEVINTIDNRTTDHYRKQLAIAAMDPMEAVARLYNKQYVTEQELRGMM